MEDDGLVSSDADADRKRYLEMPFSERVREDLRVMNAELARLRDDADEDALRAMVRGRAADADPQPGYPGKYAGLFEEVDENVYLSPQDAEIFAAALDTEPIIEPDVVQRFIDAHRRSNSPESR